MIPSNLRPELARHLVQRLQAFGDGYRHNLALIGPPGSGKTFQLQALLSQPPTNAVYLYCPLFRESCRSFLQRFLSAVLQAGLAAPDINGLGPAAEAEAPPQVPHSPDELLQQAERRLPRTAAAVRSIDGLLTRRLYGEAFNRALDTIPTLIEERRKPCVLMLDEFLFLEELGLGHAFHELGKRVMTWPTTLFILSSSAQYRARLILRERLQLLFGQFELVTLEELDPSAAAAWVTHELGGLGNAQATGAFLLRWLGAYPWYLAVFLKRLKERAVLNQDFGVTEPLVLQTAWDVLGSSEGPLHQRCASRVDALVHDRIGARAVEVLLHIAEGARTATEIGARVGRTGLSDALQRLVEHDLAARNGMCWMVADPVLRCWLSTILLSQRASAHVGGADARARCEQYLRTLWTQWLQAGQLSFPEQVIELFSRFSDDTVLLDAKTGRLPKFHAVTTHRPGERPAQTYVIAEGDGKRWCATIHEGPVDENAVAAFEAFCRSQLPKPARKVVITKSRMDENARLIAKAANMWVWGTQDLEVLRGLYGWL